MKDLDDKLNHLSQTQDNQGRLLHEVHQAVIGNPEMGQKGIVPTLAEHGERLTKLEDKAKSAKWFGRGVMFAGGIFAGPYMKGILAKAALLFKGF